MRQMTIVESAKAYEAWLREQLGKELVAADLRTKHQRMAESAVSVPARDLLALGRDHPRHLSRVQGRAVRARCRRPASGELRHLARRRRTAGLGRERFRRSRRDALRARPGAAGGERAAGLPACRHARERISAATCSGLSARAGRSRTRSSLDHDYAWLRQLVVVPNLERVHFWHEDGIAQAAQSTRRRSAT